MIEVSKRLAIGKSLVSIKHISISPHARLCHTYAHLVLAFIATLTYWGAFASLLR
jgi:hypothetical protein